MTNITGQKEISTNSLNINKMDTGGIPGDVSGTKEQITPDTSPAKNPSETPPAPDTPTKSSSTSQTPDISFTNRGSPSDGVNIVVDGKPVKSANGNELYLYTTDGVTFEVRENVKATWKPLSWFTSADLFRKVTIDSVAQFSKIFDDGWIQLWQSCAGVESF